MGLSSFQALYHYFQAGLYHKKEASKWWCCLGFPLNQYSANVFITEKPKTTVIVVFKPAWKRVPQDSTPGAQKAFRRRELRDRPWVTGQMAALQPCGWWLQPCGWWLKGFGVRDPIQIYMSPHIYIYIYIHTLYNYIHIHTYVYIYIYMSFCLCSTKESRRALK